MTEINGSMIETLRGLRDYLAAGRAFFNRSDTIVHFRNWIDRDLAGHKYGAVIWDARTNWADLPKTRAARRAETGTVEHAVPVNVLFDGLMAAQADADFQAVINAYTVTIVTRDEDKAINRAFHNARRHMPPGWKIGDDPLARYRLAGINVEEIK